MPTPQDRHNHRGGRLRRPTWRARSTRRSYLGALDLRAELTKPLVDALVAAVDLTDVPDRRRSLGTQGGDHHRHAGADVRALEALTVEPRRACHHRAMRIAEDDPRPPRDELVDEEQPALEHLLEDEHRPARLCRRSDGDRGEVGGKRRPDPALDLRDLPTQVVLDMEILARRDVYRGLPHVEPDAELAERR